MRIKASWTITDEDGHILEKDSAIFEGRGVARNRADGWDLAYNALRAKEVDSYYRGHDWSKWEKQITRAGYERHKCTAVSIFERDPKEVGSEDDGRNLYLEMVVEKADKGRRKAPPRPRKGLSKKVESLTDQQLYDELSAPTLKGDVSLADDRDYAKAQAMFDKDSYYARFHISVYEIMIWMKLAKRYNKAHGTYYNFSLGWVFGRDFWARVRCDRIVRWATGQPPRPGDVARGIAQ